MIKKIIEKWLDSLLCINSFQDYINHRYNRKGYTIVQDKYLEDVYYLYNDIKYHFNDQLDSVQEAGEYNIQGILPHYNILDIGANIGSFSIPIAKKLTTGRVFSVEPLYHDIIKKNAKLNNIHNIHIMKCGHGEGITRLNYDGRTEDVKCYNLRDIIKSCNVPIDVVKMDTEGSEQFLTADDLINVKIFIAELHTKIIDPQKIIDVLLATGFACEIQKKNNWIVYATK